MRLVVACLILIAANAGTYLFMQWLPTILLAAQIDLSNSLIYNLVIRSEEHTSELQSLMRISYAVFCLKKKKTQQLKNIYIKTCNLPQKVVSETNNDHHNMTEVESS